VLAIDSLEQRGAKFTRRFSKHRHGSYAKLTVDHRPLSQMMMKTSSNKVCGVAKDPK
jgi:predicted GIY-YIG superfamily endonuclease